jgi:hypothetical protein
LEDEQKEMKVDVDIITKTKKNKGSAKWYTIL